MTVPQDRPTPRSPQADSWPAGIPHTMAAAYVEELGGPEVIRFGELPVPRIGPTDVLVEVQVTVVDPVDTFVRSGSYATPTPFPFVIGRDAAGTVAAVGSGVSGFSVGDRVWEMSLGHGGRQGPFAQYAAVTAERLYHLPDGADPVQAVGLAHMAATAWLGLFRHGRLLPGQNVYIGGGAGNIGSAAVRLAAGAGARVISGVSAADRHDVLAAGAAAAVDYRDPDITDAIRSAAPGGLDLYWDTSGHHDLVAAVSLMRRGGRILLTAAGSRADVPLPVSAAYTRDVSLVGFAMSNAGVADLAAAARALNECLDAGTLAARVAETLPLADAAKAHRIVEAGGVRGRVIVRV